MARDTREKLRYDHSAAIKPAQVEELVDFYVNRRLAAIVVQPLLNTHITPNQLTVASTLFGAGACVSFAHGSPRGMAIGAVSILLAMVMDCADGQLARARGGGTRVGRIFDGMADYINAIFVHVGLLLFLYKSSVSLLGQPAEGLVPFLVMAAAGASMTLHAAFFDLYKGRFQMLTGICKPEMDPPDEVLADLRAATHAVDRVLLWGYWRYCVFQASLNEHKPAPRRFAPGSAQAHRIHAVYERNLRMWSFLGPTTHMAALALAGAIASVTPYAIWWYVVLVTVPVNLYMIGMLIWTKRLDQANADVVS
ncbi:MAG: hypothetical protein AMXMBFR64_47580 [Myxococcales bacterium]